MTKIKAETNGHDFRIVTSGMKVEFNPIFMLKENFNKGTQQILDKIIQEEWKKNLNRFADWHKKTFAGKDGAETEAMEEKFKTSHFVDLILILACFSKDILRLHSDYETITLTQQEKEALHVSSRFWRYSDLYGYKTVEQNITEADMKAAKFTQPVREQPKIQQQVQQTVQPKPQQQQAKQEVQQQNVISVGGVKFTESVNLQPEQKEVPLGADGLPAWFEESMKIAAKAMYVSDKAQAMGWLLNISNKQGTGATFGQDQITAWFVQNVKS